MDKQPILSLCIPTNGAVEWILPVIESIYSQGYDNTKFEVVITDNGKDSQLASHLKNYKYSNLRYIPTTDEGFLNLVTSLKEGQGLFCKMINHRSVMVEGSVEEMISLVEKYKEIQPIIYCSNGNLNVGEILECDNLDEFVRGLSYWSSWSAGIGFWKKDLHNFNKIKLYDLMPNAPLLFDIRDESKYVIWNKTYMNMENDTGKGGYDLFQTFAVGYLDIINDLRFKRRISQETFLKVKSDLFDFMKNQYLREAILPTKHTFIIGDVRNSLSVYYSTCSYYKMVLSAWLKAPYFYARLKIRSLKGMLKKCK